MQIEAFKRLPASKQRERVGRLGVPLSRRESQRYHIYLYAVYHFYAELYFFKQSGAYGSLQVFEGTDKLTPYLLQIDISFLFPD